MKLPDIQFFNWLINVFKNFFKTEEYKQVESTVVPAVELPLQQPETDADILKKLAVDSKCPIAPVISLLEYRDKHFSNSRPRYWAVADMSQHSSKKRLFIFDVNQRTVQTYFVAHGKGSDPNYTGWCSKVSNTPNSLMTSEGIYRCAETYISGKFGYAMRLDGLQSTNSNARVRAIVFHGAAYVKDSFVKLMGKCGRSEGCTAVDFKYSKDLIDKLKNGSLMYVWKG